MLKHTDFIPSLSISVRVVVVVVKLWPHTAKGRLAHAARTANGAHVPSRWHHSRARGTSHVWGVRRVLNGLTVVDLGHPPDAPASQPRVLVAVPPAVDGPLDQASLSTKARVQLGQRPANRVALSLVHQPVAAVLVFAAACPGVHAVLRLEFRAQSLNVDRLDVAPDGVLHLDAVAGVFEGDPLDTIVILANN